MREGLYAHGNDHVDRTVCRKYTFRMQTYASRIAAAACIFVLAATETVSQLAIDFPRAIERTPIADSNYGWAFSAYTLANIIGLTVAGSESDRNGPGRPYLFGIALFCVGLLVAGAAPGMMILILGRAIQGFGGGLFNSAIYVVVGRAYPASAKPKMLPIP